MNNNQDNLLQITLKKATFSTKNVSQKGVALRKFK